MSNGKAVKEKTLIDEIVKTKRERVKQYGIGRQLKSVQASKVLGTSGAKGGSDSSNDTVNYLKTAGGTMIGPIAFFPESHSIVDGVVDVSESTSGVFTSRVVALGESGAADDIVTIKGAAHSGQLLFLQAVSTTALTLLPLTDASQTAWVTATAYVGGAIRINNSVIYTCILAHTSGASTEPGVGGSWETNWLAGNIYLPDGTEYIIAGKEIVQLQFDSTNNTWTILGVSETTGDNLGDHTATTALDMAGNNIGGVGTILFTDTVQTIGSISNGLEVRQSDTFDFSYWFNGVETYTLAQGAMDFHGQNIGDVDTILFTDTVQTIGSISSGLEVRQSDTFDFSYWFNGAETYTLAQGAMNFHDQNIAAVDTILMSNGGATIFSISSGIETRVSGTFDHSLWVGGVEEYTFNATDFTVNDNKIEFTLATQFIQGSAGGLAIQVPAGVGSTIDFSTSGGSSQFNIGQSTTVSNQDFDINANALILDADADSKIQAGTDDVIQITNGGTLTISLSETSLVTTIPITMGGIIDMNTNNITMGSADITECKNILTDGDVTNRTVGASGSTNGFDFYVRNGIFRDANPNTKINFDATGLHLETDSTGDDIDITTVGLTSDITATATGDIFIKAGADTNIGTAALPTMIQVDATGVFFNSTTVTYNVDVDMGTNWTQYDGMTGAGVGTVPTDEVRLFLDSATEELSVKHDAGSGGLVVSLEGGGGVALGDSPTWTGAHIWSSTAVFNGTATFSNGANAINITNSGSYIQMNEHPIEFDDMTNSAVGSVGTNERRLFNDSANNSKLSVKRPDAITICCEGYRHGTIPTTTNAYFSLQDQGDANGSVSFTVNELIAIPFIPPEDCTITGIGFYIGTGGSANADVIVGLYANSPGTTPGNYPTAKIQQTNAIDTTTTGNNTAAFTSSQTLAGGVLYWIVFNQQNGATEPLIMEYEGTFMKSPNIGHLSTTANSFDLATNDIPWGWRVASTYNTTMPTFPSSATPQGQTANAPAILVACTVP